MNFQTEIIIDRPVQEVWDFFSKQENLGKWLSGFQSVRVTSGEFGKAGAKAEHTYKALGRDMIVKEEVLVSEPYKLFKANVYHPTIDSRIKTVFEDWDTQTKVTSYVEIDIKAFALKLIKKLIVKYTEGRQQGDWNKLKSIVESKQPS